MGTGYTLQYTAEKFAQNYPVIQLGIFGVSDDKFWSETLLQSSKSLQKPRETLSKTTQANLQVYSSVEIGSCRGSVGAFTLEICAHEGEKESLTGQALILAFDWEMHTFLYTTKKTRTLAFEQLINLLKHGDFSNYLDNLLEQAKPPDRIGKVAFHVRKLTESYLSVNLFEQIMNCAIILKQEFHCQVHIYAPQLIAETSQIFTLIERCRLLGIQFLREYFPVQSYDLTIPIIGKIKPSPEMLRIASLLGINVPLDQLMQTQGFMNWTNRTNRSGIYTLGLTGGLAYLELHLEDQINTIYLDIQSQEKKLQELSQNMSTPTDQLRAPIAQVHPENCVHCLTCSRVCPHDAITAQPYSGLTPKLNPNTAFIRSAACQGCGICLSDCPNQAIAWHDVNSESKVIHANLILHADGQATSFQVTSLKECTPEEISILDSSTPEKEGASILAFACSKSGFLAGLEALKNSFETPRTAQKGRSTEDPEKIKESIPLNVEIREIPCAGLVSEQLLLHALTTGVQAIILWHCHSKACQHQHGDQRAQKRIQHIQNFWLPLVDQPVIFAFSISAQEPMAIFHHLKTVIRNFYPYTESREEA